MPADANAEKTVYTTTEAADALRLTMPQTLLLIKQCGVTREQSGPQKLLTGADLRRLDTHLRAIDPDGSLRRSPGVRHRGPRKMGSPDAIG
jgi:hypothetical protein